MLKMIKAPLIAGALAFAGVATAHAGGLSVSADHSESVELGKDVKGAHKTAIDASLDEQNTSVSAGDAAGVRIGDNKASTSTNVKVSAPTSFVAGVLGD